MRKIGCGEGASIDGAEILEQYQDLPVKVIWIGSQAEINPTKLKEDINELIDSCMNAYESLINAVSFRREESWGFIDERPDL
ncbi:hypothetical protein [Klebsiella quasipneumoniae]|uniref:hypothetical protein n=1 Tax=Klebsiella quasipneumoniae TaxID=1463165 RepID=UPI00352A59E4